MPTTSSAAASDGADQRADQRRPQQRAGLGRRGAQQGEDRQQHPEPVREVEHAGQQPGRRERRRQPQGALEVHRPRGQVLAQALPPQPRGGLVGEPQRARPGGRRGGVRADRRSGGHPDRRHQRLRPLPQAERERVQPQPLGRRRRRAARRRGRPGTRRAPRQSGRCRAPGRRRGPRRAATPPRHRRRTRPARSSEAAAGRPVERRASAVVQVDGTAQEQPGRRRRDRQRPVAAPGRGRPLHRRRPRRPQRLGGLRRGGKQGGQPVAVPVRAARPAVGDGRQAAGERADGACRASRCRARASGRATAPAPPPASSSTASVSPASRQPSDPGSYGGKQGRM